MKTSFVNRKIIAASIALIVVYGVAMLALPHLLEGGNYQAGVSFEWSYTIDLAGVVDEADKERIFAEVLLLADEAYEKHLRETYLHLPDEVFELMMEIIRASRH